MDNELSVLMAGYAICFNSCIISLIIMFSTGGSSWVALERSPEFLARITFVKRSCIKLSNVRNTNQSETFFKLF